MTDPNDAPLSERLDSLDRKFGMAYDDLATIREAVELARRVEGAPVAMIEDGEDYFALAPTSGDDFVVVGRLAGQRVRIVVEE